MRTLPMLALLVAGATPAAAQQAPAPMPPPQTAGTVLDIVAEGRVTRTPDIATIRAGVVSQASSAAAALAQNAAAMTAVLAALKRAGVGSRDVTTAQVQLQPQYRYADNQPPAITGYQASNSVSIRFREVARAGPVLDTLATAGANQIEGPTLSLAEPDVALDAARTDAVARARARAQLYARAAGLRVTGIVSIDEAGGQAAVPRPMMFARTLASPAAATPVVAGEEDVTATLNVRFLLQ